MTFSINQLSGPPVLLTY